MNAHSILRFLKRAGFGLMTVGFVFFVVFFVPMMSTAQGPALAPLLPWLITFGAGVVAVFVAELASAYFPD